MAVCVYNNATDNEFFGWLVKVSHFSRIEALSSCAAGRHGILTFDRPTGDTFPVRASCLTPSHTKEMLLGHCL